MGHQKYHVLTFCFQYAKSGMSSCDADAMCGGQNIPKGSLRYGISYMSQGLKWIKWWHWYLFRCIVVVIMSEPFQYREYLDRDLISKLPKKTELLHGFDHLE